MQTILLGISSSIAVYKAINICSDLLKLGYDVEVIMTKNATEFISPLIFSSLTKHKTYVDTFDRNVNYSIEHISLATKADVFCVVPASANVIAKCANGIADDMLTTTFLAFDGPKIICPAMNTKMYENPITQANIAKLKNYGIKVMETDEGRLACGDVGKGRLIDIEDIKEAIIEASYLEKPLIGKRILISAGATKEAIDPVRYISNHSSGKMGYALAKAARNLGAEVILVSGETNLKRPYGVKVIDVLTANEMYLAIKEEYEKVDGIIMAAAVSDYHPLKISEEKIKKSEDNLSLNLTKTVDILKFLGENKSHQVICGFAMETENTIANAYQKFKNKRCDMLVLNDLKEEGAGFKKDTNVVTIIKSNSQEKLSLMSKEELAYEILERMWQ